MLEPLWTALQAAVVFIGHALVVAVIAVTFKCIELLWSLLWPHGTREPMIIDSIPLRYILEIGETAVIIVFIFYGTREAIEIFRARWRR